MASLVNRLEALFDSVADSGNSLTFWWRDDDAQRHGPKLSRLYDISHKTGMPLCLAVIPEAAENNILADAPDSMVVFQHGLRHRQEQIPGEKKCEFPDSRDTGDILNALHQAREKMETLFSDRFRPCLTPPWNRFADAHKSLLPQAGFSHLSRYNSPNASLLLPDVSEINTHIDIIDWKPRCYAGDDACFDLFEQHIAAKMDGRASWDEALGILSHHMDHDAGCDRFLTDIFTLIDQHPATRAIDGCTLTR